MTKVKETFIGEAKVEATFDDPTDKDSILVLLSTKGDNKISMKRKLYELIVRPKKGNGNVTEVRNSYVAQKFALELADYGYERYEISGVADAIGTLIHNVTEAKIGEKFGVANSDKIRLSDLIE